MFLGWHTEGRVISRHFTEIALNVKNMKIPLWWPRRRKLLWKINHVTLIRAERKHSECSSAHEDELWVHELSILKQKNFLCKTENIQQKQTWKNACFQRIEIVGRGKSFCGLCVEIDVKQIYKANRPALNSTDMYRIFRLNFSLLS